MQELLEGLNKPQRAAVEDYQGATLVIAGAGSGKTRVLTLRIANMLGQGIRPDSVLALTFTNKAAREMRERIAKVLPPQAIRGLWMGTFHSIFCRILRNEASLLGFPDTFTIYDTADSRNVVKAIIKQMELPDEQYKPNEIASRISLAKNNLVLPAMYAANDQLLGEDRDAKRPQLYQIYEKYMNQCRQNGAMDFDDMLLYMNVLLKNHPEVAERYGNQFRYILVDEYQDTNFSQYLIVKKLAAVHGNVCVVGDDSQSIYSFRGARIENILRFQKDYPDAKLFKLEQNYRSTSNIVNAANSLIEKNSQRLPKKLFSAREPGDLLRVLYTQSDKEEAMRVSSDIHTTMYTNGALPSEFAILYRTNAQSRVFEEYLRGKGIPYRIYGGHSFYQRAEIKDMIAYLRFAVNPKDDQAFLRIINFPARGIGATSLEKIELGARERGCSMWEIINALSPAELGIKGGAVKSIAGFIAAFKDISAKATELDAYTLAMEIVGRSGVLAHYQMSKLVEDESKFQNTEELLNSIKVFVDEYSVADHQPDFMDEQGVNEQGAAQQATVPQELSGEAEQTLEQTLEQAQEQIEDTLPTIGVWLQDVSLLTDMDTQQDQDDEPRVTLLTVHASKGLEFKYTYIVGMEENLFPSLRGVESQESIEEERRLFYVALTRAELRATLSFSTSRFKWGQVVNSVPSRFLKEIDPQYMDLPTIMNYLTNMDASEDDDLPTSPVRRGINGVSGVGVKPASGYQPRQRADAQAAPTGATIKSRNMAGSGGSVGLSEPPAGFTKVAPPSSGGAQASDMSIEAQEATSASLTPGIRVEHQKFGRGTVVSLETTATDTRVVVEFDKHGQKTLLLKFAKLHIIRTKDKNL